MMFCVKCGKPAKVEHFCEEHFLERQELFKIKDFSLIYCEQCKITEEEIKEAIRARIKSEYNIDYASVALKIVGNKVHAKLECEGKIEGLTKKEQKKALIILRRKMCDAHVKLSGGYYEAMIQARGEDKAKILRKVEQMVPAKGIAAVDELKEGYNIKIVRKSNAAIAAKELRKWYKIIQSYKLVGSKKGTKLYRNYYAVR